MVFCTSFHSLYYYQMRVCRKTHPPISWKLAFFPGMQFSGKTLFEHFVVMIVECLVSEKNAVLLPLATYVHFLENFRIEK